MYFRPLLAIAVCVCLAGCDDHGGNAAANSGNETTVVELPTLPLPEPPMDRAALLTAAAKAASAAAAGVDDIDEQRPLDGNRFELRMRFGCSGPAADEKQNVMSWRFEPKDHTLRVQAAPDVSKDDPAIAAIAGEAFEAAEGFWIARPWMFQAACPAKPQAAKTGPSSTEDVPDDVPANARPAVEGALTPSPAADAKASAIPLVHTVAIAQFFSATDSRTVRRDGRAYQATKVLEEGQQPSAQGYDLVLSGRLKRLPDRRVIACTAQQRDRAPRCVISASFDRVWIERPGSGETIAEWASGG